MLGSSNDSRLARSPPEPLCLSSRTAVDDRDFHALSYPYSTWAHTYGSLLRATRLCGVLHAAHVMYAAPDSPRSWSRRIRTRGEPIAACKLISGGSPRSSFRTERCRPARHVHRGRSPSTPSFVHACAQRLASSPQCRRLRACSSLTTPFPPSVVTKGRSIASARLRMASACLRHPPR
jgi:hypothetical protein